MGTEIERKFLLANDDWRSLGGAGTVYRQGYLSTDPDRNVRVRLIDATGYLTVKGRTAGITRLEFEYEIPFDDASRLLDELCHRPLIEKTRYRIGLEGLTWEIDEFAGDNQGLIVAEVELESENQELPLPRWIGREVSDDPRYFNAALVERPFTTW